MCLDINQISLIPCTAALRKDGETLGTNQTVLKCMCVDSENADRLRQQLNPIVQSEGQGG